MVEHSLDEGPERARLVLLRGRVLSVFLPQHQFGCLVPRLGHRVGALGQDRCLVHGCHVVAHHVVRVSDQVVTRELSSCTTPLDGSGRLLPREDGARPDVAEARRRCLVDACLAPRSSGWGNVVICLDDALRLNCFDVHSVLPGGALEAGVTLDHWLDSVVDSRCPRRYASLLVDKDVPSLRCSSLRAVEAETGWVLGRRGLAIEAWNLAH